MPNTDPHIIINLQEVSDRNSNARHIVTGCAAALPTLGSMWQYLEDALIDAIALSAEVARLSAEVERTRLDRANLLAACAQRWLHTPTANPTRCGTSGTR